MTITISNTSNTDTFSYWLNRTNELADAMTNKVITVNSNNTTGNAYVNGTFSAVTITANAIIGGNNDTSSVLTLGSNVNITGVLNSTSISVGANITLNTLSISVGSNVTINSSSLVVDGETINSSIIDSWNSISNTIISIYANTSTTSSQIIDSFEKSTYRSGEYLLSIKDNTSNSYQVSKLLVLHDDSTSSADLLEYGVVFTNSAVATFSANSNTTHVRIVCTPVSSNTSIKGTRISIAI